METETEIGKKKMETETETELMMEMEGTGEFLDRKLKRWFDKSHGCETRNKKLKLKRWVDVGQKMWFDISQMKKSIYFCAERLDDACTIPGWLVSDLSFTYIKKADSIMENMPSKLQKRRCYSIKIYFIGGETWDNTRGNYKVSIEYFSTEVFAFNVKTQLWDSDDCHPNMLLPRASCIAVAADAKIFVFGNLIPSLFCNNFEKYAEYYDIKQGKWHCIPEPPQMLCQTPYISSSAVVNNHILFYAHPHGCIFIFNYVTMEWPTMEEFFGYPRPERALFDTYPPPHLGPCWSNQVVAFYDALFWHHGGIIYAYDFKKGNSSVIKLRGFENPYFKNIAEKSFWPDDFPSTFLLSQQEGRMCLIWRTVHERPIKYYCQNFRVERQNGELVIHVGSCPTLASLPKVGVFWNVLLV